VNIAVSGTATSGTDYTALGTTVTFAVGAVEATKAVVATADSTSDNNETVIVTLQSGSGYTVGTTSSLTVTIEDAEPVVTVATTTHATEGGADGTVTFTRSGATMLPLTVNFTLGGTASDMTDYIAPPLSAYFAPGSATAAVSITSLNDAYVEGTETVVVTLQSGTGYSVGSTSTATANITDDDTYTPPSTPIITVLSMYDAEEGANVGRFRLTRDGNISSALTVSVSVGGTATAGTDYTALPSTVTFAAGETSADLTVTAGEDNTAESTETVQLSLLTGSGYVLGAITTALVSVFEANAPAPAENPNPGNGLFARYYNNADLFDMRTARVDEKIEFNWGLNAPQNTAVGADHFSVMWVGRVKAEYTADYTFHTDSDDGIRVWVNNQLLIDDWNEHPSTSRTANAIVPFTAGQVHDIRVEYFEGLGGAEVTLSWSNSVVAKKVPVPKSQLYAIAFDIDVNADGDITDTVDGANDYLPGYEGSVAKVSTTSAFNATADAYRGQNMKLVLDGVGTGTTDITKVEFVITNPTQYAGYASNKSSPIVSGVGKIDDFSFSKIQDLRTIKVEKTPPANTPNESTEQQSAAQEAQIGAAKKGGGMEANKTWVYFYAKDYGAWAKVDARVYLGGATPAYTLNLTTSRDTDVGGGDKLADKWEVLMARRQATQIGDAPYTLTQSLAFTLTDDGDEIDPDGPQGPLKTQYEWGDAHTVLEEYRGYILDGGGYDGKGLNGHAGGHIRLDPARKEVLVEVDRITVINNIPKDGLPAVLNATTKIFSHATHGAGIYMYYVLDEVLNLTEPQLNTKLKQQGVLEDSRDTPSARNPEPANLRSDFLHHLVIDTGVKISDKKSESGAHAFDESAQNPLLQRGAVTAISEMKAAYDSKSVLLGKPEFFDWVATTFAHEYLHLLLAPLRGRAGDWVWDESEHISDSNANGTPREEADESDLMYGAGLRRSRVDLSTCTIQKLVQENLQTAKAPGFTFKPRP
jgi:PA14 domain/Calx-beta domain